MAAQPRAFSACDKAIVPSMSQPPATQSVAEIRAQTGLRGRERGAHGVEDLEREAHAVLEAAAVVVVALVGERRQELVQQVAVRGVQLDARRGRGARRAAPPAAKSSRIRCRPAASSAAARSSPAMCGTADGATACQLPGSPGAICVPPSHGARLEALRPAWASCIAERDRRMGAHGVEHPRQRRLVVVAVEAEVGRRDAALGRDRGGLDDQQRRRPTAPGGRGGSGASRWP